MTDVPLKFGHVFIEAPCTENPDGRSWTSVLHKTPMPYPGTELGSPVVAESVRKGLQYFPSSQSLIDEMNLAYLSRTQEV
ncbi:hypothetical protein AVEN_55668-1 [Araneus ventricosus]|uniref:Uncharacterized protein n=1 Tax=Araneus ventricosus TaxID=182803 RepID=A0A4Y2PJI4_ARAVE|nr:hypothetical protein AVEN_55668-1 [Araneus ventricosus]